MSLREWLLIIGVIVLVGILVDGFRRMWLARKRANELRFGLEEVKGGPEAYGSELPNGGARISRTEGQPHHEARRQRIEPDFSDPLASGDAPEQPTPRPVKQSQLNARTDIPDLEDTLPAADELLDDGSFAATDLSTEQSPQEAGQFGFTTTENDSQPVSERIDTAAYLKTETLTPDGVEQVAITQPLETDETQADNLFPDVQSSAAQEPAQTAAASAAPTQKRQKPDEFFIIHVFARGQKFSGEQLLQQVMSSGMRFGEMNIFHGLENQDGIEAIEFSMANAEEPGVFNLDNMDMLQTTAVTFFMSLPGPSSALQTLNRMEQAARNMANALNGELKDENHSVFTQQTLEHYRQRVRDYELRQLALQNLDD